MFSCHGFGKPNSPGARRVTAKLFAKPYSRVQRKYHNRPDFGYQKQTGHGRSSGVFLTIYTSQVGVAGIKQDKVPVSTRKSEGGREGVGRRDEGSVRMDGYQMNARELGAQGKKTEGKTQYLGPPSAAARKHRERGYLRRGLVLRGHAVADGHTGILATGLLLLLEVLIIGHLLLLLVGHVAGVHARTRHVGLRRIDIVADILGSLGWDIGSIDTILVGSRVRCIQACLDGLVLADLEWRQ